MFTIYLCIRCKLSGYTMPDTNDVKKLILSIFNSKRLLAEHAELVEMVLCYLKLEQDNQSNQTPYYLRNASLLLVPTLLTYKLFDKRFQSITFMLPAATTILCCASLSLWSGFKHLRNKFQSHQIFKLIKAIDSFELCIKRNISYFNELNSIHSEQLNAFENSIFSKFHNSITAVTTTLYEICTKLEQTAVLPAQFANYYQPLESIDFDLLQKQDRLKTIKNLYNLFLYVQSQLLTRIAIAMVYNYNDTITFCSNDIRNVVAFLFEEIGKDSGLQRTIADKQLVQAKFDALKPNNVDHISCEPIISLKNYSLSCTAKVLAISSECGHLDNLIQSLSSETDDKDLVMNIIPKLNQIEDILAQCQDDFQRFSLAYHKYVASKWHVECDVVCAEEPEFKTDSNTRTINFDETVDADQDEFYALMERTEEDDTAKRPTTFDEELKLVNAKIVKQKFKPVLKQLRNKIEPINKSMKDRERKFLLAKGLPSDHLSDDDEAESCSSDDSADDRKPLKRRTNYDDVREFLEQKQQFSLMPMMRPAAFSLGDEDILE